MFETIVPQTWIADQEIHPLAIVLDRGACMTGNFETSRTCSSI